MGVSKCTGKEASLPKKKERRKKSSSWWMETYCRAMCWQCKHSTGSIWPSLLVQAPCCWILRLRVALIVVQWLKEMMKIQCSFVVHLVADCPLGLFVVSFLLMLCVLFFCGVLYEEIFSQSENSASRIGCCIFIHVCEWSSSIFLTREGKLRAILP